MNDFDIAIGPESKDLLIVFDYPSINDDYALRRLVARCKQSKVFVNTYKNQLGELHLDKIFERVELIERRLAEIKDEMKPERTATFGVSLGAFAALHLGSRVGADVVVALSPETLIGMPGSRSASFLKGRPTGFAHPDVLATYGDRAPATTHIYFGEEDLCDVQSAWRMRDAPGVRLHSVVDAGHSILRELMDGGFVAKMLGQAFDPDFAFDRHPKRGSLCDHPDAVEMWFRGVGLMQSGRTKDAEQCLRQASAALPTNGLLQFHLSRTLIHQKRIEDARDLLAAVLRRNPDHRHAASLMARIA